jgi:hypothetical protein
VGGFKPSQLVVNADRRSQCLANGGRLNSARFVGCNRNAAANEVAHRFVDPSGLKAVMNSNRLRRIAD